MNFIRNQLGMQLFCNYVKPCHLITENCYIFSIHGQVNFIMVKFLNKQVYFLIIKTDQKQDYSCLETTKFYKIHVTITKKWLDIKKCFLWARKTRHKIFKLLAKNKLCLALFLSILMKPSRCSLWLPYIFKKMVEMFKLNHL